MASDDLKDAIASMGERLAKIEMLLDRQRKSIEMLLKLSEPFGVYLGGDVVLTQMMNGLRLMVPASDSVMAPKMIGNRVWEPRITAQLQKLIKPNLCFIDVGANIGYFSVNAALLLAGSNARVYAFEPNPTIYELLSKNIQINWSLAPISLRQIALGADLGQLELRIPGTRASNATLLGPRSIKEGTDYTSIWVDVTTIDKLGIDPKSIGTIKIDVEGAEAMVVQGAKTTLRDGPQINLIMEWDTKAQADDVGATSWLIEYFASLGFRAYILESGLQETPLRSLGSRDYCNLFLTRDPTSFGLSA
ncbi:MAG: FkbM family methyltransferase [Proteobacteria bacterium]|nr:FkbM family methyltransferase [Pseudomonadota bacterium]